MIRNHGHQGGDAMRIECPHCRVAIDVVEATPGSDVTCPSCGSRIERALASTLIVSPEEAAEPDQLNEKLNQAEAAKPTESENAAPAPPKRMLGRYELESLLGRGAFGEVWKAFDTTLHRRVALKLLRSQAEVTPGDEEKARDARLRFEREARTLVHFQHPGIVRVYEFGEIGGRLYLASELIEGLNLQTLLKRMRADEQSLTLTQAAQICGQVAEALHATHQAGIVHRDLKPANILIDTNGVPHVADFGLAKREAQAEFTMTQDQTVLGTPEYMSPEQWRDSHTVGPASDIYSLGVILYELLTGRVPFPCTTDKWILLRDLVLKKDPIAPRRLNFAVPVSLETICLKCLEKDPSRRFPTAADLAQELHRFLHGEPIQTPPITQWERARKWCQRNPALAALIASVAVILSAGISISTFVAAVLVAAVAVSTFFALKAAARARDLLKETKRANDKSDEALANEGRADAKADEARQNLYDADMNLAQRNWEIRQFALVLDSLEKTRPQPGEADLRGFEWHYWDRLCHSSLLDLKGQTGPFRSVAFSTDGKRLASASSYNTVTVWDAASGQESLTLKGHKGNVMCVAFCIDGKRLASASDDQTVKVWDVTSGEETLTLKGRTGTVYSVAFSPDGNRLASSSVATTVKVWDALSGQEMLTLNGHNGTVWSVAFSPDGKRLASASSDGTVKVWDATSGQELLTLKGHQGNVMCVAFCIDGKRLASASSDGTVKVWDVMSSQETLTLEGHSGAVFSVAFSPDGKRLASASGEDVKVWDAASGQESLTLKGHTAMVWSVAFSPDGKRLASASSDGTVKVWDFRHRYVPSFPPPSASSDGTVKMWDGISDPVTLTLEVGTGTRVAFSADGKRLASASDGTVKVWDAMSGQETLTLKGHVSGVNSVVFSADGKRLASASDDKTVKVWDGTSGQEMLTLKGHNKSVWSMAFSPDGKRLATASGEDRMRGEFKVWDSTTGQETFTLTGHTDWVNGVAFSADGKRLASASSDGTVKVWDAMSGQETLTLKGHASGVNSVVFSADGKRLVSASDDKTVKVWDATSGQETLTLKGHTGKVDNVAFSADGTRLVSASGDGTVKVWDARPWTPELRAEREALSLIHFLRDQNHPQSEWLAAISSDKTLSDLVRQRALQFAREWK